MHRGCLAMIEQVMGDFRWSHALSGLFLALLPLSGCSTLTSYPQETQIARQAYAEGRFAEAWDGLQEGAGSRLDGVCYTLEQAMVTHSAGDFGKSNARFEAARRLFDGYEQDRIAAEVGEQIGAALWNEKVIPYKGEMFEKALIHVFWGINYLCLARDQASLDEAHVEVRRTNQRLRDMREEFEEELAEARDVSEVETDDGDSIDVSVIIGDVQLEMQRARSGQDALFNAAGSVYDVGFAHYLSGLIYEEQADRGHSYELDNARISYERVVELNPEFPLAKEALLRISHKLGDAEAVRRWQAEVGHPFQPRPGTGRVVVLYECGLAPEKEEVAIRFPVFIPGLMQDTSESVHGKLAFPRYRRRITADSWLELVDSSGVSLERSWVMTDIEAMAVRFLWDRMGLVALRTSVRFAIRTAASIIASRAARKEGGELTHK